MKQNGGRPRGALNKRTVELQKRLAKELGKKFDPVVILAGFAADENNDPAFRADCAAKVAPYVHSRLKQTEAETNVAFDADGLAERIKRARERAGFGDVTIAYPDPAEGAVVANVRTGIGRTPNDPLPPPCVAAEREATDTTPAPEMPATPPRKAPPAPTYRARGTTEPDAPGAAVQSDYSPYGD